MDRPEGGAWTPIRCQKCLLGRKEQRAGRTMDASDAQRARPAAAALAMTCCPTPRHSTHQQGCPTAAAAPPPPRPLPATVTTSRSIIAMATVTRVSALLAAVAGALPLIAGDATSASATGSDPAVIVPL